MRRHHSPRLCTPRWFDLTDTYFVIGGITGVNPNYGTTGAITLSRFAVRLILQYEVDSKQLLKGGRFSSGFFYIAWGRRRIKNNLYLATIYGTDVFELDEALRKRTFSLVRDVKLSDTEEAVKYRKLYPMASARRAPGIALCDTGTSDAIRAKQMLFNFLTFERRWS